MSEAINSENQEKLAVMDGIPGGFVRMMVRPDGSVISLYHSKGYQRMVNMSAEELREIYGKILLPEYILMILILSKMHFI
ncbi:MAG: hypothetical protein GX685_07205 [Clostridiales bacterium]|nr:hypothetical protein [Clostridiales bacterium]